MSTDLERYAKWYREEHGDTDIAQILEGLAQVSRKRGRPEHHAITLAQENIREAVRRMVTREDLKRKADQVILQAKESDQRALYEQYQEYTIQLFKQLSPNSMHPVSLEEIAEPLNKKLVNFLPDSMPLHYLIIPVDNDKWKTWFPEREELVARAGSIDPYTKGKYNHLIYTVLIYRAHTVGEAKDHGFKQGIFVDTLGTKGNSFIARMFKPHPSAS